MQRGGSSLDTWVLTDGAGRHLQHAAAAAAGRRHRAAPPRRCASRTGENLFWLGRYTERTEQLVRLARAAADADRRRQRCAAGGAATALSALAVQHRAGAARRADAGAERAALFERALLAGLATDAGDGAPASPTTWRRWSAPSTRAARAPVVRTVGPDPRACAKASRAPCDRTAGGCRRVRRCCRRCDRLALQLAAVTGAQTDRMTRDHGWRLLTVGRLLERLIGMSARLRRFVEAQALTSVAGIELLLELFDSADHLPRPLPAPRGPAGAGRPAGAGHAPTRAPSPACCGGCAPRLGKLPGDAPRRAQRPAGSCCRPQGAGLTLESLRGADDAALARDAAATLPAALAERRGSALADAHRRALLRSWRTAASRRSGGTSCRRRWNSTRRSRSSTRRATTTRAPVSLAHHLAHLRPLARRAASSCWPSTWTSSRRRPRAATASMRWATPSATSAWRTPHRRLRVRATSRVRLRPRFAALQPESSPPWETVAARLRYVGRARPFDARDRIRAAVALRAAAGRAARLRRAVVRAGRPVAAAAIELMQRIHADFAYKSRSTEIDTPLADVVEQRSAASARTSRT